MKIFKDFDFQIEKIPSTIKCDHRWIEQINTQSINCIKDNIIYSNIYGSYLNIEFKNIYYSLTLL